MTGFPHLPLRPFERLGPGCPQTPLVISVPHAGRFYPTAIEDDRAVGRGVLEDLEDRHADRLVMRAVAEGAIAIVGTHARAWIDLNRGEEDATAPDAPNASPRARAGLGLVPSRLAGRALWRRLPSVGEVLDRIATLHAPYHRAVADALAEAKAAHGFALLIDCHSMPSLGRPERPGARIVIGDRHGTTAGAWVSDAAEAAILRHGITVARNVPYAGAFTIQHHGRPGRGVHAIQVEVDRSLYLEPKLREVSIQLDQTARLMADLCWGAVDSLSSRHLAQAAE